MEQIKKIAITGPTGAIGMALISLCIEKGIHVVAICHKGSKRIEQIPSHPLVSIWELDLDEMGEVSDKGAVPQEMTGCQVFYHFAWAGTFGDVRNNMPLQVENIRCALDAVILAEKLGCNTFIGAGSQAEYGRVEGLLAAQTPVNPENGYGMAKLCVGQMTRQLCQSRGIRHIWIRILSVYGPYDGENTMVSATLRKLAQGERASFTPAEQKWDYLYSADAARAMYLLGERGQDGKVYVLGSGQVRPLKEYIEIMAQAVTDRFEKKCELGIGDIPYGKNQVMYLGADISELKEDTGFEPETDFRQGIERMIDLWVK